MKVMGGMSFMRIKRFISVLTAIIMAVSLFALPVSAEDDRGNYLPFYATEFSSTDLARYKEWRSYIINFQSSYTITNINSQEDVDFVLKSMSMFMLYDTSTFHLKDVDVSVIGSDIVMNMTYKMTQKEYDEAMKAADKAYTEISKTFGEKDNSALKALKIHDYLAENINYSIEADNSDNLYGAFIGGLAKCDGYAKSFSYLLTRAGVNNTISTGETRDPDDDTGHAWNKVKIGKSWYIIDVTNDDTTEFVDLPVYDYFMISDDEYAVEYTERDDPYVAEPAADNPLNSYYDQKQLVTGDAQTAVNLLQAQASSATEVPFMMTVQLTSSNEYDTLIEMLSRDSTLYTDYVKIGGRTLSATTFRNEESLIIHIVVVQVKGKNDNIPYGK
jgi:hypothetical protein